MATPRPSRPSRVRFETRDVRVARSSTGVRCTCGLRSRWCAAPRRMPRLDKYPPAQVKLIVYASAREFGANTVSDMARFPANTSVLYRRKATSREPRTRPTGDTGDLFRERLGRNSLQAPTRIFSIASRVFFKWPPPRMPPWADRAAHGGTMHGGHVDRWTERATSNLGASHSGASLRAYPAPRDAVRVHASSPRKRAIRASHSASLPCRDPGSDADLPPSARRPRRRGPARRVHRTRGRRVPHAVGVPAGTRTARTRAFAKRVTKTRDDFVFGVFSTTALTTFSSPSRRRVAVETPTALKKNHPHRLTESHTHVTSHTSLPTSHTYNYA